MADSRAAWRDTGERLNQLGLKLKLHYEQQRGEDAERARGEVEGAVRRLVDAVQDAFESIGAAAKDQAVREDVKQVGQSLTDALNATFAEVSDQVRKVMSRPAGGPSADRPSTGEAGTPGTTEAGSSTGTEQPPREPPQQEDSR